MGASLLALDADTGLVHLGAREYDPETGAFTRRDPSGLEGGENQYAYAGGDPVNYWDPDGNFVAAVVVGAAAGAAIGGAEGAVFGAADEVLDQAFDPGRTGFDCGAIRSAAGRGAAAGAAAGAVAGGAGGLAKSGGGASDPPVEVSRWGRPGLKPGDWVMKGPVSRGNYFRSGKWQPGLGNQFAPYSSGRNYTVPQSSLHWPSGFGVDGWIKGLFGQRIYRPGAALPP